MRIFPHGGSGGTLTEPTFKRTDGGDTGVGLSKTRGRQEQTERHRNSSRNRERSFRQQRNLSCERDRLLGKPVQACCMTGLWLNLLVKQRQLRQSAMIVEFSFCRPVDCTTFLTSSVSSETFEVSMTSMVASADGARADSSVAKTSVRLSFLASGRILTKLCPGSYLPTPQQASSSLNILVRVIARSVTEYSTLTGTSG